MDRTVDIAKALAHPARIRMLLALRGRELCACQLVELLRNQPPTVSRHMGVLRRAGLVVVRRHGRWAYYRRAGRGAPEPVTAMLRWVDRHAGDTAEARRDEKWLQAILQMPVEEICKKRGGN